MFFRCFLGRCGGSPRFVVARVIGLDLPQPHECAHYERPAEAMTVAVAQQRQRRREEIRDPVRIMRVPPRYGSFGDSAGSSMVIATQKGAALVFVET